MKVVAKNRRARFDYEIQRIISAGIVLYGPEVKSVRAGLVSLKGAFARVKDNELWLYNMQVTAYPLAKGQTLPDPDRPRKLLVSKHELALLDQKRGESLTIVPLTVLAGRYIKIELGVGRGKKKYDKREVIKKRDMERAAAQAGLQKHRF
ncbi:MAG TPA: SsrA-binding protein SmpB [Candidatus Saccharimonadales bacterium]|nr:SsrA-binding protein SmpB [Candidatus Saccharimonadales bacterium]